MNTPYIWGLNTLDGFYWRIWGLIEMSSLRENAHMFEIMIHNLESVILSRIIISAARRPISTAKLVPLSQG